MDVQITKLNFTPEELEASPVLAGLLSQIVGAVAEEPSVPTEDVEADDATAHEDDTNTAEAAPTTPGAVPGIAEEGQADVLGDMALNPFGDLFRDFLAEVTTWPNVGVFGIKRKGSPAGTPLDYQRYLRVRKMGSQLGGFAYVHAIDGRVNLRLNFGSDEELAAIAPDAYRLHKGHRAYRVSIRIVDEATLKQAIELARRAYDLT